MSANSLRRVSQSFGAGGAGQEYYGLKKPVVEKAEETLAEKTSKW